MRGGMKVYLLQHFFSGHTAELGIFYTEAAARRAMRAHYADWRTSFRGSRDLQEKFAADATKQVAGSAVMRKDGYWCNYIITVFKVQGSPLGALANCAE